MIAYLDASVILRVVLGQPGALGEWKSIVTGVSSALAEVECLRTMDRLRLLGHLSVEEAASGREAVYRIVEALEVVDITPAVLRRASQPVPAPLGTLEGKDVHVHRVPAALRVRIAAQEIGAQH